MRGLSCLPLLAASLSWSAWAAPVSCFPQAASSPTLRSQGIWEQAGDLLLICTGGTPTAPGATVPLVDITVSLAPSLGITSRILHQSHNSSEALLLIDEPQPARQEACAAPRVNCGLRGAASGSAGINYADPKAAVNGNQKVYNIYQADAPGGSAILFREVPFDPPGDASIRVVRITNLFVNASQAGAPASGTPLLATVSSSGGVALNIAPFPAGIGLIRPVTTQALLDAGGNPVSTILLDRAAGNNVALAANPSAHLASDGVTFHVRLSEAEKLTSVFNIRNGASWTSLDAEPDLLPQNVPGTLYFSETGFFNPAFPGTANLKRAGLASRGTRILVRFSGVPAGVKLFAPVRIGTATSALALRMIYAQPDGESGTQFVRADPVSPAGGGIAPLLNCPSACQAVYEVVRADATSTDNADIPIYVAFAPGAPAGTASARITLAPLSSQQTASYPIGPRFAGFSDPPMEAFRLQ